MATATQNGTAKTTTTVTAPNADMLATLMARLDQLEAENARLKAGKAITLKVSEKGAISVYGLGRFPTTLYVEQMERLLGHSDQITAFIAANRDSLKVKGE